MIENVEDYGALKARIYESYGAGALLRSEEFAGLNCKPANRQLRVKNEELKFPKPLFRLSCREDFLELGGRQREFEGMIAAQAVDGDLRRHFMHDDAVKILAVVKEVLSGRHIDLHREGLAQLTGQVLGLIEDRGIKFDRPVQALVNLLILMEINGTK